MMMMIKPPGAHALALICALAVFACASKSEETDKSPAKTGPASEVEAPAKLLGTPPNPAGLATPEPAKPKPKPEKAGPPKPGTFISYNLGLLTAVGLNKQRLPKIIEAMKETRASVACLQEVWDDADYQTIASELAGVYPHSFREKTEERDTYAEAPCNLAQALAVKGCADKKCAPQGTSLFECMATESMCKPEYDTLSADCKLCLAANTDTPTSCAMGSNKAAKMSFWGGNGLALLSWSKIENPTFTVMESQLVTRGVITATIDGRTVQCTHLSTEVAIVPRKPGGAHESWQAEHMGQMQTIDKVADTVADKAAGAGGCRVLIGDMNTGPAVAGLTGEFVENYPFFKDKGWLTAWDAPECTFCPDNPLTGAKQGSWIDHIFFKGCKADAKFAYSRVFDGEITVENEGKNVATRLSDHYGVMVEATDL